MCWSYGATAGDTLAPQGDDSEFAALDFQLKDEVPLFNEMRSKIYVSIVLFDDIFKQALHNRILDMYF